MTFKLGRKFYFIIILCGFLWNQQLPIALQKITLENSYRDKVRSNVSRYLGQDNFIVIVNIKFFNVTDNLKRANDNQSGKEPSNGYFIPGILPTVPTQNGSSSNSSQKNGKFGEGAYSIERVEVNIELAKELLIGTVKKDIKGLIEKAIPRTKDCKDCIKIEALQFLPSEKSILEKQLKELKELPAEKSILEERLETLKKQVDELQSDKNSLLENKRKTELDDLERSYNEVQKILEALEKRDLERERLEKEKQEKELKELQNEKKLRNEQIIKEKEASEERVEMLMKSKITSDSLIISEAMDMYKNVMKQKGGGDADNEALLGMQIGNSTPGMINAIIFLVLIFFIIILLFIALSRKKHPIYLKPTVKKKMNDEAVDDAPPSTSTSSPSEFQRDEDAIRSELRSLRQTAVSLTVGEKESASALIKEWLDDNPNKSTNPAE